MIQMFFSTNKNTCSDNATSKIENSGVSSFHCTGKSAPCIYGLLMHLADVYAILLLCYKLSDLISCIFRGGESSSIAFEALCV